MNKLPKALDLVFLTCAVLLAIDSFRRGTLLPIGIFAFLLISDAAWLLITDGLKIKVTVRNR